MTDGASYRTANILVSYRELRLHYIECVHLQQPQTCDINLRIKRFDLRPEVCRVIKMVPSPLTWLSSAINILSRLLIYHEALEFPHSFSLVDQKNPCNCLKTNGPFSFQFQPVPFSLIITATKL